MNREKPATSTKKYYIQSSVLTSENEPCKTGLRFKNKKED